MVSTLHETDARTRAMMSPPARSMTTARLGRCHPTCELAGKLNEVDFVFAGGVAAEATAASDEEKTVVCSRTRETVVIGPSQAGNRRTAIGNAS